MEKSLQERCDLAFEILLKKKDELKALIKEYGDVCKGIVSPLDLLDVKDKFLAYSFTMTEIMLRTKELHLQSQREVQSAYNSTFLSERDEVVSGKKKSLDTCKMNAQLAIAGHYITDSSAEINYTMSRAFRDECQRYIDAVIQRVSVVKGESFNSRQTNNA